ncbi:dTDP-4-dehydrorhamnose 3,5-epimerase [soil metagenome]
MHFEPTSIEGVRIIHPKQYSDERGYFARTWDIAQFAAHNMASTLNQCSTSFNHRAGTLRGMHFQKAPHEEAKVIRCTRGAIYDVAVDLRPASPTFKKWVGAELNENNGAAIYIPKGCAHGFLTLQDYSEVLYLISSPYVPEAGSGVRYNDPAFGIEWPRSVEVIIERDANYPDFVDDQPESGA